MRLIQLFFFVIAVFIVSACAKISIMAMPKMSSDRTEAAISADEFFWTHFHSGDFDKIDSILTRLKAAYLKDPRDWLTASHIAFVHAWRLTERARFKEPSPSISDDAILAQFYFREAHSLYPKDARIHGFLADMTMAVGRIHEQKKIIREGYCLGLDAIRAWPEFNLFSIGYVMSNRNADDEMFKEALAWQWKTLDLCSDGQVNYQNPSYVPIMKMEDQQRSIRKKSVCWNSWIAPHNFEGFFLNMGDMLLKAGEKEKAIAIYENARLSTSYEEWPYRHILEQRLLTAHAAPTGVREVYAPKPMMLESTFSCMACHQEK